MSIARQRTDIETFVFAQLPLVEPTVDMTFENSDFKPKSNSEWVRFSFSFADMTQRCIGKDGALETLGFFNVQIFTPVAQGAGRASIIMDSMVEILRKSNLTGIEFLSYDASFVGQEAGWYNNILRAYYRGLN